jgi:hypothetical protein
VAIHIEVNDTDDPGFIASLNALVLSYTKSHLPEQVWIILIDNWFDHKWLRFSGNGAIAWQREIGGITLNRFGLDQWDAVKAEFHRDKLTFPPFSPSRVIGQRSYVRQAQDYVEAALPTLLHRTQRSRSESNLNRRIQNLTGDGCFVWYSGNTVANGRGSVMVYNVIADSGDCWFAAFTREQCSWTVTSTVGVDRGYVEALTGAAR